MPRRSLPIAAVVALSILAAATLVAMPVQAQNCTQVEVQNVRPDQGMLMIAAYADADTFNKSPAIATRLKAGAATMTFPLCGVAGGWVALTLFQDLNDNGKLDANVFGIPSEPWGSSGKPVAMSAPTWETSRVPLDGSTIVVKLSK